MNYRYPSGFSVKQLFSILRYLASFFGKKRILVKDKKMDRVLIFLLIILTVFNGFIFAKLNDLLIQKEVAIDLLPFLALSFGFFIVLKYIFPSFRSVKFIGHPYYNINPVIQFTVSFFKDLYSFSYLLIPVFYIALFVFSKNITLVAVLKTFPLILCFPHINRSVRTVIESRFHLLHVIYLTLSIGVAWLIFHSGFAGITLMLPLPLMAVSYFSYTNILHQKRPGIAGVKAGRKTILAITLKYLLSSQKIRSTLILLFLIKIIYLLGTSSGLLKFMAGYQFFYLVCILPILLFTYLFNNIFSFTIDLYRNVFFTADIKKNIIKAYLCPLLLILLPIDFVIDLVVFVIQLFFHKYFKTIAAFDLQFLAVYLTISLNLAAASVFFSLRFPKSLATSINKQLNTNFISSLITLLIGVLASLSILTHNFLFMMMVSALNLTGFIAFSIRFFKQENQDFTRPLNCNTI